MSDNPVITPKFVKNGFTYELALADWPVAIYSQSKKGVIKAFEVIVLRRQKPHYRSRLDTTIDSNPKWAARYPSGDDWGLYGWTYSCYGGLYDTAFAFNQAVLKKDAELAIYRAKVAKKQAA